MTLGMGVYKGRQRLRPHCQSVVLLSCQQKLQDLPVPVIIEPETHWVRSFSIPQVIFFLCQVRINNLSTLRYASLFLFDVVKF